MLIYKEIGLITDKEHTTSSSPAEREEGMESIEKNDYVTPILTMNEVIHKGLIVAWIFLGIWMIYLGIDNILLRSMERDMGLMALPPGLPYIFSFEKLLLGGFSFFIAKVLQENKENKIQYLFVFLGILLITIMARYALVTGLVPLLILLFLPLTKRFLNCLLLLTGSFLFYIILQENRNTNIFIINSMNSTTLLIGCLLILSFFAFNPKNKALHAIQIGRKYRLMLLFGFVPSLLDFYLL